MIGSQNQLVDTYESPETNWIPAGIENDMSLFSEQTCERKELDVLKISVCAQILDRFSEQICEWRELDILRI